MHLLISLAGCFPLQEVLNLECPFVILRSFLKCILPRRVGCGHCYGLTAPEGGLVCMSRFENQSRNFNLHMLISPGSSLRRLEFTLNFWWRSSPPVGRFTPPVLSPSSPQTNRNRMCLQTFPRKLQGKLATHLGLVNRQRRFDKRNEKGPGWKGIHGDHTTVTYIFRWTVNCSGNWQNNHAGQLTLCITPELLPPLPF